jgi:hypothetical protein
MAALFQRPEYCMANVAPLAYAANPITEPALVILGENFDRFTSTLTDLSARTGSAYSTRHKLAEESR